MSAYRITTQTQVRSTFWETSGFERVRTPRGRWLTQNEYSADVRCAFVDFVDHLAREGTISEALAQRVTL